MRSLRFPVTVAIGVSLAAAPVACTGAPPPAYPAVRYEAEPFPPPAPRGAPADAGAATEADANTR